MIKSNMKSADINEAKLGLILFEEFQVGQSLLFFLLELKLSLGLGRYSSVLRGWLGSSGTKLIRFLTFI